VAGPTIKTEAQLAIELSVGSIKGLDTIEKVISDFIRKHGRLPVTEVEKVLKVDPNLDTKSLSKEISKINAEIDQILSGTLEDQKVSFKELLPLKGETGPERARRLATIRNIYDEMQNLITSGSSDVVKEAERNGVRIREAIDASIRGFVTDPKTGARIKATSKTLNEFFGPRASEYVRKYTDELSRAEKLLSSIGGKLGRGGRGSRERVNLGEEGADTLITSGPAPVFLPQLEQAKRLLQERRQLLNQVIGEEKKIRRAAQARKRQKSAQQIFEDLVRGERGQEEGARFTLVKAQRALERKIDPSNQIGIAQQLIRQTPIRKQSGEELRKTVQGVNKELEVLRKRQEAIDNSGRRQELSKKYDRIGRRIDLLNNYLKEARNRARELGASLDSATRPLTKKEVISNLNKAVLQGKGAKELKDLQAVIDPQSEIKAAENLLRSVQGKPGLLGRSQLNLIVRGTRKEIELLTVRMQALQQVKNPTAKQQKDFDRLSKRADFLNDRLQKVNQSIRELDRFSVREQEIKIGEDIISRLPGGVSQAIKGPREDLPFVIAALKRRYDELDRTLRNIKGSTAAEREEMRRIRKEMGNLSKSIQDAKIRMRGFGTAMQQVTSLFRQFFRYALGYGALYQVLRAFRALAGGVLELEAALKSIQAVSNATAVDMQNISDSIKRIALETKFSTTEIAEAGRILAQSGVRPEDFDNVLESTALFASATESSIENAADLISTMRNIFTELNDTTIANQLTRAINISKLTADDLKTILSRGAQVAKGFNLTSEQFLAAVTVLRNAGIKASTVATGLRQGLIELLSPDAKTITALEARYRQLGEALTREQIQARFFAFTQASNPLLEVLRELKRVGFTGQARQQFQRIFDVRATNAINALLDNLDKIQEAETKLTFGNAALEASQTQMESFTNSVKNLGAAITSLSDSIGRGLVEDLEDLADRLTNVVRGITDLNNELKVTTGTGIDLSAGAVAGAASAVVGGGGFLARSLRGLAGLVLGSSIDTKARQSVSEAAPDQAGLVGTISGIIGGILAVDLLSAIKNAIVEAFRTKGAAGVAKQLGRSLSSPRSLVSAFKVLLSKFPRLASLLNILYGLGKIVPFIGKLTPIGRVVTSVATFVGAVVAFSAAFRKSDSERLRSRLEAASAAYKEALANAESTMEEFSSFLLPATGRKVKVGGQAEATINLERSVRELDQSIINLLRVPSDRIQDVRDKLIEIADYGSEAGSEERKRLIGELEKIAGASLEALGLTDRQLTELANDARDQQASAEELREAFLKQASKFRALGDEAKDYQKAYLQSFDALIENEDTFRKLTGLAPATSRELVNFGKTILEGMETYLEQGSSLNAQLQKAQKARQTEIELVSKQILESATSQDLRSRLLDLAESVDGVGEDALQYIDDLIEILRGFKVPEDLASLSEEEIDRRRASAERRLASRRASLEAKREQGNLNTFEKRALESAIRRDEQLLQYLRQSTQNAPEAIEFLEDLKDSIENAALQNREERIREVSIRQDAAREIFNTPEFRSFLDQNPSIASDVKSFLDSAAEDLVQEQIRFGKRTGEFQLSSFAERTLKLFDDFQQRQLNLLEQQKFQARPEDEQRIAVARVQLKRAKEQSLADLVAGPEVSPLVKLLQAELKLIDDEIAVLEKRAQVLGGAEEERAVAKITSLQKKRSELILKYLDERTNAQRELLQREVQNIAASDPEIKKQIAELDKQIALSKKKGLDISNLIARKSALQLKQLDRQIAAQELLLEAPKEFTTEKQRIAARRRIADLQAQRQVLLFRNQTEIEKAFQEDRLRELRSELSILKDRRKNIERSLDFAFDSADFDQISSLTQQRIDITRAILDKEKEILVSQGAASDTIRSFEVQARLTVRQMERLVPQIRRANQAIQQVYNSLLPLPTGNRTARQLGFFESFGVPLNRQERLDRARLEKIVRSAQLEQQQKVLSTAESRLQGSGLFGTTEQALEAFRLGRTDVFSPDQLDALQSVVESRNAIQELERQIGNLDATIINTRGNLEDVFRIGVDPNSITAKLQSLDSDFSNLGTTIQDDIVEGLDNLGNAFADGLVKGKSFANGMKKALSDMFFSVAASIAKSGFMNVLSAITGSIGLQFPFKFSSGGVVQKKAEGGIVTGPGTETSDSVPGVVVDTSGRIMQGLALSRGEGLLTREATAALGSDFINAVNRSPGTVAAPVVAQVGQSVLNARATRALGPGFVAMANANPRMAAALVHKATGRVARFASGGIIKKASSASAAPAGQTVVNHTFSTDIQISADSDSGVTANDLAALDRGLEKKISEYIREQMRPGGLLRRAS